MWLAECSSNSGRRPGGVVTTPPGGALGGRALAQGAGQSGWGRAGGPGGLGGAGGGDGVAEVLARAVADVGDGIAGGGFEDVISAGLGAGELAGDENLIGLEDGDAVGGGRRFGRGEARGTHRGLRFSVATVGYRFCHGDAPRGRGG